MRILILNTPGATGFNDIMEQLIKLIKNVLLKENFLPTIKFGTIL